MTMGTWVIVVVHPVGKITTWGILQGAGQRDLVSGPIVERGWSDVLPRLARILSDPTCRVDHVVVTKGK